MFTGGDQYKNNLSNNVIIRCHECGSTELRYIGDRATPDKSYICENGHYTWGAIDDQSIDGQTDTLFSVVEDCCCEGLSCDFPKSIIVTFSGIIGIQAIESDSQRLDDDIISRTSMPFTSCNTAYDQNHPGFIQAGGRGNIRNESFKFQCGLEKKISDNCFISHDGINFSGLLNSDPGIIYTSTDGSNTTTVRRATFGECSNDKNPLTPCEFFMEGTRIGGGGYFPGGIPDIQGPTFLVERIIGQNIANGDDCPDCRDIIQTSNAAMVPVSIRTVNETVDSSGTCRTTVTSYGYYSRIHPIKPGGSAKNPWMFSNAGVNGGLQNIRTAGYVFPPALVGLPCAGADISNPTPNQVDLSYFCFSSGDDQTQLPCTDCATQPTITNTIINSYTLWPWRIPLFGSTKPIPGAPTVYYTYPQLIRNNNNKFDGRDFLTQYECGCRDELIDIEGNRNTLRSAGKWWGNTGGYCSSVCIDESNKPNGTRISASGCCASICPGAQVVDITNGNPHVGEDILDYSFWFNMTGKKCFSRSTTVPEGTEYEVICNYINDTFCPSCMDNGTFNSDCFKPISYPSCLASGTLQCSDVDSRFRIPCSTPNDYFTVTAKKNIPTNYIGNNRHSIFPYIPGLIQNEIPSLNNSKCGFHWYTTLFNPTYVGRSPQYTSAGFSFDLVKFPGHPNPQCGQPQGGWFDSFFPTSDSFVGFDYRGAYLGNTGYSFKGSSFPFLRATPFAEGVGTVNMNKLTGGDDVIQQPHCVRRVKMPSFKQRLPKYGAINTEDISNQNIILDRFYPTGKSFDYVWYDKSNVAQNNVANQSNIAWKGDLGISQRLSRKEFPLPFIANSGSLTEPEIIAIIHSESGVGGQIAFDTFPVAIDTDILIDVEYDEFKVPKGKCPYKHRITAHGYGVMYPLIDDPLWKENELYEYPVFLKGKNYNIGDKIEFRCWKTLEDSMSRNDNNGQPIPSGVDESIWGEECREIIVATATISEVDENGGILWYEFDETDSNEESLISIGNCPCAYDKCSNPSRFTPGFSPSTECKGCVSKDCYPSGHMKIDALTDGFGSFPSLGCLYIPGYTGPDPEKNNTVGPIPSLCEISGAESNGLFNCPEQCQWSWTCRFPFNSTTGGLAFADGWYLLKSSDNCINTNCSCTPPSTFNIPNDIASNCQCSPVVRSTPLGYPIPYIGPYKVQTNNPPPGSKCFPKNKTWEFYENNFARSPCSGVPVVEQIRPYMSGHITIPSRQAQYKYVWLPKTDCIQEKISIYSGTTDENILNFEKDKMLSDLGCNPLKLDRFGRSYKFPTNNNINTALSPCRKNNPEDVIPEGSTRTLDDYCRVYGFYQQRQPACEVVYRGQYILRASQRFFTAQEGVRRLSQGFYNNEYNYTDCDPVIDNITIILRKKEAKFDVSVGAPYNQDYLIPENLPVPVVGPDGKLESFADSWDYPSLVGTENTRLIDHGFFEPNRKIAIAYENPNPPQGQSSDLFAEADRIYQERLDIAKKLEEFLQTGQFNLGNSNSFSVYNGFEPIVKINPDDPMYDVDGISTSISTKTKDFNITDIYISGQWDLPDPRSNCRINVEDVACTGLTANPEYGVAVGLPVSGIRNDFKSQCPYPWEITSNDPVPPPKPTGAPPLPRPTGLPPDQLNSVFINWS